MIPVATGVAALAGSGAASGGVGSGMFGLLGGGAISALGSLGGGLFSSNANLKAMREANRLTELGMREGVRMRVADAKAAGLHPLAALGANISSPFPQILQDQMGPAIASAGQDIGNAIQRMKTPLQRAQDQLSLQLAQSQIKESDARADLYASEAARNRQTPGVGTGLGIQSEQAISGQTPTGGNGVGYIDLEAMKQMSAKAGRPDTAAGRHPYYQEYVMEGGLPFHMPVGMGEGPAEVAESMSVPAWLGLLQHNSNIYGKGWFKDFVDLYYFGQKPTGKYKYRGESQKSFNKSMQKFQSGLRESGKGEFLDHLGESYKNRLKEGR